LHSLALIASLESTQSAAARAFAARVSSTLVLVHLATAARAIEAPSTTRPAVSASGRQFSIRKSSIYSPLLGSTQPVGFLSPPSYGCRPESQLSCVLLAVAGTALVRTR